MIWYSYLSFDTMYTVALRINTHQLLLTYYQEGYTRFLDIHGMQLMMETPGKRWVALKPTNAPVRTRNRITTAPQQFEEEMDRAAAAESLARQLQGQFTLYILRDLGFPV